MTNPENHGYPDWPGPPGTGEARGDAPLIDKIVTGVRREAVSTLDLMELAQKPHLRKVRARDLPEGQLLEQSDTAARPDPVRPAFVREFAGSGEWSASIQWFGMRRALGPASEMLLGVLVGAYLLNNWLRSGTALRELAVPVLVGVAMLGFGLWGACRLAVVLLNRTTVELREGRLMTRHGPLREGTAETNLASSDVRQLYIRREDESGFLPIPIEGGSSATKFSVPIYELYAVMISDWQSDAPVLRSPDYTAVRYIERAVELQLGIDDEPVSGEYVP